MSAALRVQRFAALLLLVLVTTFALLATSAVVAPDADAATDAKVKKAFRVAKRQVSDPYNYGSAGPNRFDCSGLLYFSFKKRTGVHIPRVSRDQYRYARSINKSKMHKGDLMAFYNSSGSVYHIGLFAGWNNGKRIILHSPSTGSTVHRSPLWTNKWKAATLRNR
ncbi:hypothetical protein BH24ACT11_BH24ACT11_12050 [soil metagenome]